MTNYQLSGNWIFIFLSLIFALVIVEPFSGTKAVRIYCVKDGPKK